ncbi:MAG: hypothetical protein WCR55_07945 [Lentisphaerota bacterium]
MRTQRAVTSFTKFKDNDLFELSQSIVNKMTKNIDFPTPIPTLIVVQAAVKAYSDALLKCQDGTKQDTANKNAKREILENNLSHLGAYINSIAEGNLTMIDGSGFPVTKIPEPVGIPPAPEYLKLTPGDTPGVMYADIGIVSRALSYIVIFSQDPIPEKIDDWHAKTFSKSTGVITGLVRGKKYTFMAAATSAESNKTSFYNFTKPIEIYIQ